MPDSFPRPYCGKDVAADAGRLTSASWFGERSEPAEATTQRARCPHCDKPIIRAAGVEDSRWQEDRTQPDF